MASMETESKLSKSLDQIIKEGPSDRGRIKGRIGRGGRGPRGQKRDRDLEASNEPIRVARRIYVSNLSLRTSWQDLKDHFKGVGTVVYADVLGERGRSKGCGIVEFETPQQAADAINELHLSELNGQEIYVREDREDYELKRNGEHRPPTSKQARKGGSAAASRVFVSNLSFDTDWRSLKDHFNAEGAVVYADVLADNSGRSKGVGILEFQDPESAQAAIQSKNNTVLDGREISVREDREAAQSSGVRVFVNNLSYQTSWQGLKDHFAGVGKVLFADVIMERSGRSRGCGVVEFADKETARAAIDTMNNSVLDGREIYVREDQKPALR